MAEIGVLDTNGILLQPWIRPRRTSAGLGWERVYLSTQRERPYRADFAPAGTHQLILHLNGPVQVRRGHGQALGAMREVPAGGLFLHPAGRELAVELGGQLDTVHLYLTDAALQEAASCEAHVELAEELGSTDPLVEQLMLAIDGVVQRWEPSARTYVDHLATALAAHLAREHCVRRQAVHETPAPSGLSPRQLADVRELMERRLDEPLPLSDLAEVAGLSVSQFSRQFKASTGEAPHRFLLRLRLDQACRLLRTGSLPIAEVAVRCGFSHQEHLTNVMRTKLGTTPAALRRRG
jgi:AraC family transcriptional regulator